MEGILCMLNSICCKNPICLCVVGLGNTSVYNGKQMTYMVNWYTVNIYMSEYMSIQ